eukprot:g10597.t1
MDRLDAVAGEIVEVHDTQDALDPTLVLDSQPDPLDSFWNSTEAPESLSTLKSTESTLTLPYSPGTMDGIAASMMTTEAQKAVLASVLTEQALPASCLHRSEAVVDSKKAERYRKIRAAKAKFHRSVRCASCPEPVKAKLRAMAGSRDQLEWDKFYDEYVNCGGKWANSELVMNSSSTSSHERRGRWKTMSRTALLAKYQDEVIVDEIIARKTEQGLWIANADLPDNEDGVTKD